MTTTIARRLRAQFRRLRRPPETIRLELGLVIVNTIDLSLQTQERVMVQRHGADSPGALAARHAHQALRDELRRTGRLV